MKWIVIDTNGWVSFLESQVDKEVFNDLLDNIQSGEWQLEYSGERDQPFR
jgi:hypothetical protein